MQLLVGAAAEESLIKIDVDNFQGYHVRLYCKSRVYKRVGCHIVLAATTPIYLFLIYIYTG